ncbi:DUF6282 family protein [uncultured Victivallis sp.]|uniref:DUF6282 family protein n=1 Tax=uncultured Victivallis sp. TaxID=354118 RepID=UPI0025EED186|nr:DUF6282 family protein [uncultured Victivallis sp.]
MNRRDFIKTLGVPGRVMLVGGAAGAPVRDEMEVRQESSADPLLAGVCDIHIHCLPDTRARCIDELTLARQAKVAGYRALMYKSNDWSCHGRAYLIRQALPEFEVFGSLCMNCVHGDKVNVFAAEQAIKTTGSLCRCIWMPTLAAAYQHQCDKLPGPGIPVLDPQGNVLPEVVRVMELCAEADIIFASGHSAPQESLILARKAKEIGVKKFVVTHVNSLIWKLTRDQILQAVDLGAFVEYCYLPRLWGPGSGNPQFERQSHEEFLTYVRTIPERSFISTDLGQQGNPNPITGMRTCIRELSGAEIPQRDIDLLVRTNPAHLIGLDK